MKTISLTKGMVALVDDEDYARLSKYKWCAVETGQRLFYAARGVKNRLVYMHRDVMELATGDNICVDHIDFNGLNNQKTNLRKTTKSYNFKHRRPIAHTSKYRGVYWDRNRNKWKAQASINGRMFAIGRYDLELDAALARDEFVRKNDASGFIVLNLNKVE